MDFVFFFFKEHMDLVYSFNPFNIKPHKVEQLKYHLITTVDI